MRFYVAKHIDKLQKNIIQSGFCKRGKVIADKVPYVFPVNVLHKDIARVNIFISIIVINTDNVSMVEFVENLDFIKKILIELLLNSIVLWFIFFCDKQFVYKRVLE